MVMAIEAGAGGRHLLRVQTSRCGVDVGKGDPTDPADLQLQLWGSTTSGAARHLGLLKPRTPHHPRRSRLCTTAPPPSQAAARRRWAPSPTGGADPLPRNSTRRKTTRADAPTDGIPAWREHTPMGYLHGGSAHRCDTCTAGAHTDVTPAGHSPQSRPSTLATRMPRTSAAAPPPGVLAVPHHQVYWQRRSPPMITPTAAS